MQEKKAQTTPVFEQLRQIVEAPGYPFLRHYKEDFYRHDNNYLARTIADGVRYLWIARANGSHLVRLGVHQKMHGEIEAVLDTFPDESMDIRLVKVASMDKPANVVKINATKAREELKRLDYKVEGATVINRAGDRIASMLVKITGWSTGERPYGVVRIQPAGGGTMSRADLIALGQITECEVIRESGSLFTPTKEIWLGEQPLDEVIASTKVRAEEGHEPDWQPGTLQNLAKAGITDVCGQICGGDECGDGVLCKYGIDPETHMPPAINDRYADSIIGDRHEDYDALEVHGVRNLDDAKFLNHYRCPCGAEWSDEWSCMCNDLCPVCDKEIEPYDSEDLSTTVCEVDNEDPEFFSVYAHRKEGGVECVGDFGTHDLATQYAGELAQKYGWMVRNYANTEIMQPLAA